MLPYETESSLIQRAIEFVEYELEQVKDPGPYHEESYYDYCRGKETAYEEVLYFLRKLNEGTEAPAADTIAERMTKLEATVAQMAKTVNRLANRY